MNRELPSVEAFARLDGLLEGALAQPAELRVAWLAAAARDERELAQVRALLAVAECAPDLADVGSTVRADIAAEPLHAIGDWKLLGALGSGGAAEVFLGERELADSRQRAAIKLLRAHWRDTQSLQRFSRERGILAELDDARISRLLDGGVLADGRPWLALEYVQGQHIDRWCDGNRTDLQGRARLVIEVAGAVASAHRRLVVHRDIKPANVLVTDSGQVKLLDFGIAKVLDAASSLHAPDTQTGVLTPGFASPEQLAGQPVTTASDVYQLGMLMFVLACGRRSFEEFSGNLPGLIRAVSERDAPSPLQALGRDPTVLQQVAERRSTTPARLRRMLGGDLAALLAKAMDRDPERRYPSALEFASDLERWLHGFPLHARPASGWYRLRRRMQRNPLSSGLAVALLLSLVGYGISTQMQLQRVAEEAERNRSTRDFLAQLFMSAEPEPNEQRPASALEVLEQGVAAAPALYADQPRVLADLQVVLGGSLISRGLYAEAAHELLKAVELLQGAAPSSVETRFEATTQLGLAQHLSGQYAAAEDTFRQAVDLARQSGRNDAQVRASLAWVLHSRGDYRQAQALADTAWKSLQSAAQARPQLRIEISRILGDIARDRGEFAAALAWLQRAEQAQLALDRQDDRSLSWTAGARAQTLALAGDADSAYRLALQAFDTYSRSRGPVHGGTAVTAYRRGIAAAAAGDTAAARRDFEYCINVLESTIGGITIYPAYARIELGWLDLAEGNWQNAEAHFAAAADALHSINPAGHARQAEILAGRALLDVQRGDRTVAEQRRGAATAVRAAAFDANHPYTRLLSSLTLASPPILPPVDAATERFYETRRLRRALEAVAASSGQE